MSFEGKAVFASLPRVKRGIPTVLKGDPKGKNILYTNGKSVFIRDIENPTECDVYSQHAKDTTIAVYAPSGFYIASGDISGKLRIWDTTQKEHILKYEYQPLGRAIKDLAWSPDSKRIVTVGDGNEKYGAVFLWDSGSNVGTIEQHMKQINAVDYKSSRPYRICTASEDFAVNFYEGPPFKFKHRNSEHTNFVNCVKYSPDGSVFVSGGADGKVVLYDGKEGTVVDEFGKSEPNGKAHKGGVYGVSFSPDGNQFLTASADRTCKIWNVPDRTLTTTFKFGSDLEDMQVGCLWQGENLISVSLSGYLNYLDRENPDTPKKIIMGHYQNISAVATSIEKKRIYSASFDGRIISWDADGNGRVFKGKGHTNEIRYMAVDEENLVTCGLDDTIRFTSLETETFGSDVVSLDGQPQGLGLGKDGLVVVPLVEEVVVIRNKRIVSRLKVHYEPSGASIHPGQNEVAIGAKFERCAYIYTLENDTLVEKTKANVEGGSGVLLVGYSPDGAYLGISNDSKKSYCLTTSDYKDISGEWYGHAAKIFSLAWSPDSKFMATGGLDSHIFIYKPEEPKKKAMSIKFAHPQSPVTCVAWLDNTTLVSGAQDCCLRIWGFKA
ncbi:WD repeat-containing protein 1-like [Actinia tenebrosa]|uniref:Actin-interacting protein 1 n=1 Tax=Actinia tenebrosa TaxID=6105 RepID=A0A6P8ICY5_ACTTE|nr:WD repeat-containing protein 1-like [Actinia tenebrosa]